MNFSKIACVPLFTMLLAATARAGVLVVDQANGPGANFTSVADAVNAASDGDILLIRTGYYPAFSIDGKALTLTADAGAFVTCTTSMFGVLTANEVKNVPAGKSVAIRGLTLVQLVLRNNAGSVRFDHCEMHSPQIAADVAQSAAVSFTECVLDGTDGFNSSYGGGPAGTGLSSVNSQVHLDHCTVNGGDGGDAFVEIATNQVAGAGLAAPGATVIGGELFASATGFRGGDGAAGISVSLWCLPPTNGANGLNIASGGVVYAQGCTFIGGLGASGCSGFTTVTSSPGLPTVSSSGGSLTNLFGPTRSFVASSPTRELQNLTLLFQGTPGDVPIVLAAAVPGFSILPFAGGTLLVGSPTLAIALPALPAGGVSSVPVAVPDLGPGVLGIGVHLQSVFCPSGTPCRLGPSSAILLLDQSL